MQQSTYLIGFSDSVLRTPTSANAITPGDTFVYLGQRRIATGHDAAGNLTTPGSLIPAEAPVLLITPAIPDTIPTEWQVAL